MATKEQAWTDEEYGFLADHTDWPARRVAEALGRTTQSIYTKRWRLSRGWEPRISMWDIAEDEAIIAAGSYATVAQLMDRLPGRTAEAITTRRRRLGVDAVNSNLKRPDVIGARPLIAKTCTMCGLLLQADWFTFIPALRQWRPSCKKCTSRQSMVNREKRGGISDDEKKRQWEAARRSTQRQQALTVPGASRSGEDYVETDHAILADPDLTVFQKALRLKRTYLAARSACIRYGYRSHVGLGDPETDVWIIDNPNAERLAG